MTAHASPEDIEEAREMVRAGVPRPVVALRFRVHPQSVLRWTADIPAPRASRYGGNRPPEDGVIDEVAIERALRFEPAAIAALRPSEYGIFRHRVADLFTSGRIYRDPHDLRWHALSKADRDRHYTPPDERRAAA